MDHSTWQLVMKVNSETGEVILGDIYALIDSFLQTKLDFPRDILAHTQQFSGLQFFPKENDFGNAWKLLLLKSAAVIRKHTFLNDSVDAEHDNQKISENT